MGVDSTGFLGMKGTGDWATNQRPENWRQQLLRLYPNGSMPLTAILSMMKSRSTDDPIIHWWTKTLPRQRAKINGVYTDALLTSAYTGSGVDGATLYLKVVADTDPVLTIAQQISHFRPGHQVLLRYSQNYQVDVNAKVTAVNANAATPHIVVSLLEADDNVTDDSGHSLVHCDTAYIIGNVNPQGGTRPQAISYNPTEWSNNCQIWRNAISMTRTAQKTRLRTVGDYQEAKIECLELHGIEIEKSTLFGYKSTKTGENGQPELTMMGLIPAIREANYNNIIDFRRDANFRGKTWKEGGEDWLDIQLREISSWGDTSNWLALSGAGAQWGINQIVKHNGHFEFQAKTRAYGIGITEWHTVFGMFNMKRHPLFSHEPTNYHTIVLFEPRKLTWRPLDDTKFKADPSQSQGGGTGTDGKEEEYLTEGTLEYEDPIQFRVLHGVGEDNILV